MLALCTMVRCLRRWLASSQASRPMRSEAARVMTRSAMAVSPSLRSRCAYSPSVFSRTISRSMLGREAAIGAETTGRRLA